MSPKNPLTFGFRAIQRDPALLILEIAWRWCFGVLAFATLFGVTVRQAGAIAVTQNDASALRSHDPLLIAQALGHTLENMARNHASGLALALTSITLLWIVLSAAARTLSLNRLAGGGARLRSIIVLHGFRAFFWYVAVIALIKTLAWDARVAKGSGGSDIFLYSALSVWSVIVIGAFWLMANWHLSLAATCCAKYAGGFARGVRQALELVYSHSPDLAGVSLIFALLRLVAAAVAFVLWMLPSKWLATAPDAYFSWVALVTLAYAATADLLFLSRMAAYLAVDTLDPEERPIRPSVPGRYGV